MRTEHLRIFLNIENLQADVVLKFKDPNSFVQVILQLAAYHCYVNNHKYPGSSHFLHTHVIHIELWSENQTIKQT